jgi:hypothetical protein
LTRLFDRLKQLLETDERLNSQNPPPYSERYVAEMVFTQYGQNVRASRAAAVTKPEFPPATPAPSKPSIAPIFDGSWLQGFADVRRAALEEYGWLFRIYASEHGDGDLAWNHCRIYRRAFADLSPDVMLPKADRRLYDVFAVENATLATLAISTNTSRFLPEILGLNLAIESSGVAGTHMQHWKDAEKAGNRWKALAYRLHNSIDNHATGHTKWSLAAVQAFMRRLRDAAPSEVEAQWRRIWRPWRCQEILMHGTESERNALGQLLGVASLAPM